MTPKSDFIIRPMDERDIPAAAELERECFSDPWSQAMIREELEGGLCRLFAAESDGHVVGYAGVQIILDEGYITNVAVSNAMRRRGIGSALVNAMISAAKAESLAFITLEVRASNTPAIALYESFGFKEEGVRPRYYQNPVEDARLMTLRF